MLDKQTTDYLNDLKFKFDKYEIDRVWLFGSRSRNEHRQDSDIDLIYEQTKPFDMFDPLNNIAFVDNLQDNSFGISVDAINHRNILEQDNAITRQAKEEMILIYDKGELLY